MMPCLRRSQTAARFQSGESSRASTQRSDSHSASVPHGARMAARILKRNGRNLSHLSIGTAAIALGITATLWFYPAQSDSNSQVWVSGIQVSQSEASRILAAADREPTDYPSSETETHRESSLPKLDSSSKTFALFQSSPQLQTIEFSPKSSVATIQGQLQETAPKSYVVKAIKGQRLTISLRGTDVSMTLLQPNQQQAGSTVNPTLSWAGVISVDGSYLIQVTGSGSYSLDVALTQ